MNAPVNGITLRRATSRDARAILQALENIARAAGCPSLTFDSSITAEPFYLRHGYSVVSRGEHTLSSGGKMACVRLTKQL